jgi:hypothetical protein
MKDILMYIHVVIDLEINRGLFFFAVNPESEFAEVQSELVRMHA